jgi:hypothetical protein
MLDWILLAFSFGCTAIQVLGVLATVVALIRERSEDPRFAGARLIYRS